MNLSPGRRALATVRRSSTRDALPSSSLRDMARLYASAVHGHRRLVTAAVLSATAAGLTEGLGMASLIPLLRRGDGGSSTSAVLPYIGLFLALLIISVLLRVTSEVLVLRLNGVVERDLRRRVLDGVLRVSWPHLSKTRQGDLASAFLSETTQVANGVSAYVTGVAALGIAVVLGATAAVLGPYLTLAAAAFAVVSIVVFRRAGAVSSRLQVKLAQQLGGLNEEASTLIPNLKFLRSIGARETWRTRVLGMVEDTRRTRLRDGSLPNLARAVVELLGAVFLAGVLIVAIFVWSDVARGLVFITVFYRILPRIQTAQGQLLIARAQTVWWHRLNDRTTDFEENRDPRSGGRRVDDFQVIEVTGVSKSYPGRDQPALEDASLCVRQGTVTAVIGPTGGGKSTLIDLLTGLVGPDQGTIRVDGVLLDDVDLDHWQNRLGLVPQDPPMTYGSIAENIVWLSDPARAESSISQVVAAAQLTDLIAELPQGLDTLIGARGTSLSGGQRQRIAVARALYRSPRLLILDEATSALDPITEGALLDAVLQLDPRTAVVFITHRTTTAMRADRVVVIDAGRVLLDGSPDEVRASSIDVVRGLLKQDRSQLRDQVTP